MDPFRDELGAAHSKIAELEKEKAELEARHQSEKQALEVRLDRALHPAPPPGELEARRRKMTAVAAGAATAVALILGAVAFILMGR